MKTLHLTLTAALSLGAGCAGHGHPPTRQVLVVACDGTGEASTGCTTAFLERLFAHWYPTALGFPGWAFVVVTSGGSYGETGVHPALVVQARWEGNLRAAQEDWKADGLVALRDIPIPADIPTDPRNQSDLLSLLSIAGQVGAERAPEGFEMVVASDGVAISYGMHFGRAIPTTASILAHLDRQQVAWNFAAVAEVTWCGMTNAGATAEQHARRKATWQALVTAGGGPPFVPSARCEDLYPPVPAQVLERVASGERLQGGTR